MSKHSILGSVWLKTKRAQRQNISKIYKSEKFEIKRWLKKYSRGDVVTEFKRKLRRESLMLKRDFAGQTDPVTS